MESSNADDDLRSEKWHGDGAEEKKKAGNREKRVEGTTRKIDSTALQIPLNVYLYIFVASRLRRLAHYSPREVVQVNRQPRQPRRLFKHGVRVPPLRPVQHQRRPDPLFQEQLHARLAHEYAANERKADREMLSTGVYRCGAPERRGRQNADERNRVFCHVPSSRRSAPYTLTCPCRTRSWSR